MFYTDCGSPYILTSRYWQVSRQVASSLGSSSQLIGKSDGRQGGAKQDKFGLPNPVDHFEHLAFAMTLCRAEEAHGHLPLSRQMAVTTSCITGFKPTLLIYGFIAHVTLPKELHPQRRYGTSLCLAETLEMNSIESNISLLASLRVFEGCCPCQRTDTNGRMLLTSPSMTAARPHGVDAPFQWLAPTLNRLSLT